MEYEIDKPFVLNCWKHHKDFICRRIELYGNPGNNSFPRFLRDLKQIGNSQTDIYLGKLSPHQIIAGVNSALVNEGRKDKNEYFNWLSTNKFLYKMVSMSDESEWILRFGNMEDRYIHVHPGRYSPLSKRVRATLLKTAVAVLVYSKINNVEPVNLKTINEVRINFLSLPPIKKLDTCKELVAVIELLALKE